MALAKVMDSVNAFAYILPIAIDAVREIDSINTFPDFKQIVAVKIILSFRVLDNFFIMESLIVIFSAKFLNKVAVVETMSVKIVDSDMILNDLFIIDAVKETDSTTYLL